MTLLNFPPTTNAPIDGSFTYTANGVIYAWDGEKWTANSQEGLDNSYVNIDGDTMTGDLTVPSLNGGPLAGFRNQLINGDFRVWQRGTAVSPSGGNAAYTADRWQAGSTMTRVAQSGTQILGFPVQAQLEGPIGASLRQGVELERGGRMSQFAPGTQWTFSFYADAAELNVDVGFAVFPHGMAGGEELHRNAVPTRIGTTNRYFFTFTIPANQTIAATSVCLVVGVVKTTANDVRISGCQLEPGPVATPFEHRPIGTELSLCQRYYFDSNYGVGATGRNYAMSTASGGNGNSWYNITASFPVHMRAVPSIEAWSQHGEGVAGLLGENGLNRKAADETAVANISCVSANVRARDTTNDTTVAGMFVNVRANAEL